MSRAMTPEYPAQQDAIQRFMGRWIQVEIHPQVRPDKSVAIRGQDPETGVWQYRLVHRDGIAVYDADETWR